MIFDHIVHTSTTKQEAITVARTTEDQRSLPCCIEAVGNSVWESGASYERPDGHTHFGWEYIMEGGIELESAHGKVHAGAGMSYFLFPDEAHRYHATERTRKRFIVLCGSAPLEMVLLFRICTPEAPAAMDAPTWTDAWFGELDDIVAGPTAQAAIVSHHWHRMLCALSIRTAGAEGRELPQRWHPAVQKAVTYIHAHLGTHVSRAEVAKASDASEVHVSRLFTEATGMPIMVYVEHQRLQWAQRLLRVSDLSIAEIARRTGYDDPLYFSTRFRRQYGIAPSEWRNASG